MKLSEVLRIIQVIKSKKNGVKFNKQLTPVANVDMIPAGVSHQSPYGHVLLHPHHYVHHGSITGLPSVAHGIRPGGSSPSASGAYGHSSPGYHSTGYGGHVMGVSNGGHPAPAGYDYHPPSESHVPVADTAGPIHLMGQSKGSGSSTVTALTLLSFLFFLNILQTCLKEHMDSMNPTVMVMTAGISRTRVSKLAEMSSREQQQTVSQSAPQPVLNMNRGEPTASSDSSYINEDQGPFNGGKTKIEFSNRPDPEPEYYSPYVNRTMTLVDNNYQDRQHSPYRHYHRLQGSYVSPSTSSFSSSSSSGSNPGSNNYYPDTMDPYYMRIN